MIKLSLAITTSDIRGKYINETIITHKNYHIFMKLNWIHNNIHRFERGVSKTHTLIH